MPAVGIAKEMPNSPRGRGTTDEIGQRSYTREFQVLCSLYSDGPGVVTKAPGVPRLFTPYVFGAENDAYALARSVEAERKGPNSLYWIVTVEYRTASKQELLNQYENPLLQIPEVETYTEKYQVPVYAVYDALTETLIPCRNSAGQVFDPPPMKDATRFILNITRNESISLAHPAIDIQYSDAVNADVWWGAPAGTWKCNGVTTKRENKQLQSGVLFPYLRCTYKFEARSTWDTFLLDAGAYYYTSVGEGRRKLFFQGDDGHPAPGLLDGVGEKLEAGENPVFLPFRFYLRRPFAPLNLPQNFGDVA